MPFGFKRLRMSWTNVFKPENYLIFLVSTEHTNAVFFNVDEITL